MKRFLPLWLVLAASPTMATAQEKSVDPTKALAPYVNDLTYAVGVVDLQNVDDDQLAALLAKIHASREEIAGIKKGIQRLRNAGPGAGEVFFAFNLEDPFSDGPLLVIRPDKVDALKEIAAVFEKEFGLRTTIKGQAVLAGTAPILDSALNRKAGNAPDCAPAFAAVGTFPTRIAVVMPPAFRKSLEELLPTLPNQLGGASLTPLTRGASWAAIGVDLSAGKLQFRLVVKANDQQAATELAQLTGGLLDAAGKEMEQNSPELAKALSLLRPQREGSELRLTLDARALDATLLPILAQVREGAVRQVSFANLKQLALAMHQYHDVFGSFPAQVSYSADRKPLLSWRVHILPYLAEEALYKEFKLNEPWDSAHNKALIKKMPAIFHSPLAVDLESGKTTYQVPIGLELIFNGPKKMKIREINDGTANTILIVETASNRAVWWTQPEDYKVEPKNGKAGLLNPNATGFAAAFADGSVRFLPRSVRDEVLWLYFHPNDGKAIPRE